MIHKLIALGIFVLLFMMCWLSIIGQMNVWGNP